MRAIALSYVLASRTGVRGGRSASARDRPVLMRQTRPMADDDAEERSQVRRIGEWLTDVKTTLAVLAVVAYALLRIAYGQYYAAFRLTPDDLGLGYLELLAQSALGAVALLIFTGLLISILFAAFAGLLAVIAGNSPLRAGIPPGWAIRVTAIMLTAALGALVLVDLVALTTAVSILLFGLTAVAVGVSDILPPTTPDRTPSRGRGCSAPSRR
jgi:hypothetical protein